MAIKGLPVVYCVVGGIVLFSGIKGATLSDTVKGVLTGDITSVSTTEQISVNNASSSANTSGGTPAAVSGGSKGDYQKYAFSQFSKYGWDAGQQSPLIKLWDQESGWNPNAVNSSSGAYGIPQSLGHGHPYNLGDYKTQIDWGLNYISQRYGSPAMAWAHEQANNWY